MSDEYLFVNASLESDFKQGQWRSTSSCKFNEIKDNRRELVQLD